MNPTEEKQTQPMPQCQHPEASFLSDRLREKTLPTPGRGFAWLIAWGAAYIAASALYVAGYSIFYLSSGGAAEQIAEAATAHMASLNGIAGMYTTQFVLLVPFMIAISHFKTQSWRITLALKAVPLKAIGIWLGIWAIYQALSFGINAFVHTPPSPFVELMSGSKHLPMIIVIVIFAPIMEEFLFRGYLFKAWRHSWLGERGTILITSILFTLMHIGQYHWTTMLQLFALALILGYAREKTGSLLIPIAIHASNNLLAAVLIVYLGET